MKKLIFFLIVFSIIPITLAQEYQKYDKYDCIAEKILEDCKGKTIGVRQVENWYTYPYQTISSQLLKQYIQDAEKYFLESNGDKLDILNYYQVIKCINNSKDDYNTTKDILQFYTDHFIWKGSSLDCAWVRTKYDVNIGEVNFNAKCSTLSFGDNNAIRPECKDTTVNINFSKVEIVLFSLGGLTIFGFVFHYALNFIKSRKNKNLK